MSVIQEDYENSEKDYGKFQPPHTVLAGESIHSGCSAAVSDFSGIAAS
jgi:hypothetical protein